MRLRNCIQLKRAQVPLLKEFAVVRPDVSALLLATDCEAEALELQESLRDRLRKMTEEVYRCVLQARRGRIDRNHRTSERCPGPGTGPSRQILGRPRGAAPSFF